MNPLMLAAIPSLFQTGYGIYQTAQAQKKLNGLERPEYKMPGEVDAALTLAQQEYGALGRESIVRNIQNDLGAANMVNASRDAGGALGAIPRIEAQRQQGFRENSVLAEQKRAADLQRLSGQLQNKADYKDQEFQINEYAPYADAYAEARQQHGGGVTNVMGGMSGISSLAQMYMSGMEKSGITPTEAAGVTTQSTERGGDVGAAVRNYMPQYYGNMKSMYDSFKGANAPQSGMYSQMFKIPGL